MSARWAAVLAALSFAAQDSPKVKVEPAGIMVTRDMDLGPSMGGVFNQLSAGTQVALALRAEDAGFLSVDGSKSKVAFKDAKALLVEGSVHVTLVRGQETYTQEGVPMEKGTTVKAGELELKVQKGEKDAFDPGFAYKVGLSAGKGGAKLHQVRFLDGAGKEIESKAGGRSRISGMGMEQWTWDFRLKAPVETCTVEVVLWKDVTEVVVPLKVEVSLGL